eukprot:2705500-Alexandrium_andersonii.AAC.1
MAPMSPLCGLSPLKVDPMILRYGPSLAKMDVLVNPANPLFGPSLKKTDRVGPRYSTSLVAMEL